MEREKRDCMERSRKVSRREKKMINKRKDKRDLTKAEA